MTIALAKTALIGVAVVVIETFIGILILAGTGHYGWAIALLPHLFILGKSYLRADRWLKDKKRELMGLPE